MRPPTLMWFKNDYVFKRVARVPQSFPILLYFVKHNSRQLIIRRFTNQPRRVNDFLPPLAVILNRLPRVKIHVRNLAALHRLQQPLGMPFVIRGEGSEPSSTPRRRRLSRLLHRGKSPVVSHRSPTLSALTTAEPLPYRKSRAMGMLAHPHLAVTIRSGPIDRMKFSGRTPTGEHALNHAGR